MKESRLLGGEIWFLNQILYFGRQVKRALVNINWDILISSDILNLSQNIKILT